MNAVDEPRRYRFGPLDRAGWILGLNAIQCVALTAGLIAGGLALRATGSILPATLPVLAALVVAFGRWESRPIHEWIAPLTSWVSLRSRGLDRWGADILDLAHTDTPELPPFLAGLRFLEIPVRTRRARATGIGVVVDPTGQVFSATLRARGREFALLEPAEQTRLLDAWGGAARRVLSRTRPRRPHHLVRMGRPRLPRISPGVRARTPPRRPHRREPRRLPRRGRRRRTPHHQPRGPPHPQRRSPPRATTPRTRRPAGHHRHVARRAPALHRAASSGRYHRRRAPQPRRPRDRPSPARRPVLRPRAVPAGPHPRRRRPPRRTPELHPPVGAGPLA